MSFSFILYVFLFFFYCDSKIVDDERNMHCSNLIIDVFLIYFGVVWMLMGEVLQKLQNLKYC